MTTSERLNVEMDLIYQEYGTALRIMEERQQYERQQLWDRHLGKCNKLREEQENE